MRHSERQLLSTSRVEVALLFAELQATHWHTLTHLDCWQVWALLGTFRFPLLPRPPLTLITGSHSLLASARLSSGGEWAFRWVTAGESAKIPNYLYIIDEHLCVSWQWRSCRGKSCALRWACIGVSARQRNNTRHCACNICSPSRESLRLWRHLATGQILSRLRPPLALLRVPVGQAHTTPHHRTPLSEASSANSSKKDTTPRQHHQRWPHPPLMHILS